MKIIYAARQILLSVRHYFSTKKFSKSILNALPYWIGALLTGLVSVIYAKLFVWAETATAYIFGHTGWAFFFITPAAFVLAVWLVVAFSPYARGSGIPQVSAAIELSNPIHNYKVNKLLSPRAIYIKMLSSLVMVLGGGAVGREGPTIQISASIFKIVNDLLPKWYPKISKRNMIVTGAAAGLASAFNTPLGGIVFAIEELTKTHFSFFKSALLTGVIVGGLTALFFLGPYLYLGYPTLNEFPVKITIVVIPLAIISGITGSGLASIILYVFKKKQILEHNYQKYIYASICGFVMALIAYFIDYRVFGSGKEIMVSTLFSANKHLPWYLPLLRIIGPVLSYTTGAAGGIFAPGLSAGATLGAIVSSVLNLTATETNLMILCGMVGCLTGITRSPFTSSILVIEMTNSHNIIFLLMLTALLANLVTNLVSKNSFYDQLKKQYIQEIHKSDIKDSEENR